MKPFTAHDAAGVARGQIENAEAGFPGDDQSRGQDFNQDGRAFARPQLFDFREVRTVLVAIGQIVEKVFDSEDVSGGEVFSPLGSDALNVLDRRLQLHGG